MAARVNTKFVVALVLVLFLMAGGVVTVAVILNNRSGSEAAGDQQRALRIALTEKINQALAESTDAASVEQNLEAIDDMLDESAILSSLAIDEYLSVWGRNRTNIPLLMKAFDETQHRIVTDRRSARTQFDRMRNMLSQASQIRPGDEDVFVRRQEFDLRIARNFGDRSAWDAIVSNSTEQLRGYPDFMPAHRFRGLAQVGRMTAGRVLQPNELEATLRDLRLTLEADPSDTEIQAALATFYVLEARRMRNDPAMQETVAEYRANALEIIDRTVADAEAEPWHKVDMARLLVDLELAERAIDILNDAADAMVQQPDSPRHIRFLARTLPRLDPAGGDRARRLLRAAITARPLDTSMILELAELETRLGRFDEAMVLYDRLYNRDIKLPPLEAMVAFGVRDSAGVRLADIKLTLSTSGQLEESRRNELLGEARKLVEDLRPSLGDNHSELNYVRGKLAMRDNDYRQALPLLQPMVDQFREANEVRRFVEASFMVAQAAQRLGQTGEAIRHYRSVLQVNPDNSMVRNTLIGLLMGTRQTAEARTLVDEALERTPDDPQLLSFHASLLIDAGQADAGLETLAGIDTSDMTEDQKRRFVQSIATTLVNAGQNERAIAELDQHLRRDSADLRAIQQIGELLGTERADQIEGYLAMAAESGVPADRLTTLRRVLIGGERDVVTRELLEQDRINRPVRYHMMMYTITSAEGRGEEADEHLRQAAEAEQDGRKGIEMPDVLLAMLERSLAREDFEEANRLLERARQMNIDGVGGLFAESMVRLTEGRPNDALSRAEAGLQRSGANADGHVLRGRALEALGRLTDAIDAYRRAVSIKSDDVRARRLLSAALERQGELALAIAEAEMAMRLAPRSEQIRNDYLRLLERQGRGAEAIAVREQLRQREPENLRNTVALVALLGRQGQPDQSVALARSLHEQDPDNTNLAVFYAQVMSQNNQAEQALALMRQLVERADADQRLGVEIALARMLRTLGEAEPARQTLVNALGRDDANQSVKRELAALLGGLNRHQDAARLLSELIESFPEDASLRLQRTDALLALNMEEAAHDQLDQFSQVLSPAQRTRLQPEIKLREIQIAGIRYQRLQVEAAQARRAGNDQAAQQAAEQSRTHLNQALALTDQMIALQSLTPQRRAATLLQRSRLRLANNQQAEAMADLNQALRVDPAFHDARIQRAQLYMAQNEAATAARDLREILNIEHDHYQARRALVGVLLARLPASLNDLRLLLDESQRLFPRDDFWLGARGQLEFDQGRFNRSLQHFTDQLAIRPSAQAVVGIARANLALERPQAVIDLLRNHPDMLGEQPLLRVLQGRALIALNQSEQGSRAMAIALDAAAADRGTMGQVIQQIIQSLPRESAIALLQGFADRRTDEARLHAMSAVVSLLRSGGRNEEALTTIQQLDEQYTLDNPQSVELLFSLAILLDQAGRPADSVAAYDRILAINPREARALNNSAFLMADRLEQAQEAVRRARQAVELMPNDAFMLDTLGWALFQHALTRDDNRALLDEALQTLNASIGIRTMPYNCFHLASLYLHRGDQTNARLWLNRAAQLAEADRSTYGDLLVRIREVQGQVGR